MNSARLTFVMLLAAAFLLPNHSLGQKIPISSKTPQDEKIPQGAKVPKPSEPTVQTAKSFSVAKPYTNEYGVEWHPHGESSLTLSVSGPNDLNYRETFGPDTLPYFDFNDGFGNRRPDGVYTYQLTVNPQIDVNTYHTLRSVQESPVRSQVVNDMKATGEIPADPITQTGSFTFKNHEVIMGDAVNMAGDSSGDSDERKAQKDIVHNDDVIIAFSQCVGNDCNNGESFGFDTIRLKENNLRIKFDDTSVSASFPNNDWQITANDSSNGGANKFSIDDISGGRTPFTLRAGAPSNSLYVDAQGDVGLNTSNPVVELHMVDGDTPTLRLEQDGSNGWNSQTWDLSGNETNFFLRDTTNGSNLIFRARPGAPANSLYIENNGRIGFGNSSPKNHIDVEGNAAIGATYAGSSSAPANGLIVEGNVGVGTTTPASPLDIIENDSETYKTGLYCEMQTDGSSSGLFFVRNSQLYYKSGVTGGADSFVIIDADNSATRNALRVQGSNGTTELLTVKSGGNVGIGTESPSDKLEVTGNIRVTGGSFIGDGSKLNPPDYVFEDDYSLLDISEVSRFIEEHGHLPNVPSAEEIQRDGINLSEFQMKLLEKVEELTLYVIDQRNRIEELEKTMEDNGIIQN